MPPQTVTGVPTVDGGGPGIDLITAEHAPLLACPYFRDGDPGPIVAALAQVPEVLEAALPFISVILGPSSIPLRRRSS